MNKVIKIISAVILYSLCQFSLVYFMGLAFGKPYAKPLDVIVIGITGYLMIEIVIWYIERSGNKADKGKVIAHEFQDYVTQVAVKIYRHKHIDGLVAEEMSEGKGLFRLRWWGKESVGGMIYDEGQLGWLNMELRDEPNHHLKLGDLVVAQAGKNLICMGKISEICNSIYEGQTSYSTDTSQHEFKRKDLRLMTESEIVKYKAK